MLRYNTLNRRLAAYGLALTLIAAALLTPATQIIAADHGDAPGVSNDRAADLDDVYLFLDPNDNSRVVIAMTAQGFIVPSEAVNFGIFDSNLRYRFEFETSGDAAPDHFIDINFTEKTLSGATPQIATVVSSFFTGFNAPTTAANLAATGPAPTITTNQETGIQFYAGVVDDPFTFDIPAFQRFVASVNAGSPDPTQFQRGRDSFAGYNTMAIALSIPISRIRGLLPANGNVVGLSTRTARRVTSVGRTNPFFRPSTPIFTNVDRAALPAINVALIPYPRKNEFNLATTLDDAAGLFAGDIVAALTRFGTNATNIGILANIAVVRGDFLRLNLAQANTGAGSGDNPGAGFPNGRRMGDDVIDTILFFIANQNPLSDNANSLDVPLRDTFPFFGAAQQPRANGTADDNTRN